MKHFAVPHAPVFPDARGDRRAHSRRVESVAHVINQNKLRTRGKLCSKPLSLFVLISSFAHCLQVPAGHGVGKNIDEQKDYYNRDRTHASLAGKTPEEAPGVNVCVTLKSYRWQEHCHGLFQTPTAA